MSYDEEPDPRDAKIARLKAQIDEDNEVILEVREHNRRLRAANAEMRAALERHVCQHVECSPVETHAGCHARALLSRPDLGAGMVVVPREVVERWRYVLTELTPTCRCDEAWTSRGRHEVNALCHMADDAKVALTDLDALLKGGG